MVESGWWDQIIFTCILVSDWLSNLTKGFWRSVVLDGIQNHQTYSSTTGVQRSSFIFCLGHHITPILRLPAATSDRTWLVLQTLSFELLDFVASPYRWSRLHLWASEGWFVCLKLIIALDVDQGCGKQLALWQFHGATRGCDKYCSWHACATLPMAMVWLICLATLLCPEYCLAAEWGTGGTAVTA